MIDLPAELLNRHVNYDCSLASVEPARHSDCRATGQTWLFNLLSSSLPAPKPNRCGDSNPSAALRLSRELRTSLIVRFLKPEIKSRRRIKGKRNAGSLATR